MPLPPYFTATTLRTLSATTGEQEKRVHELATRAHPHLVVGEGTDARIAAAMFLELTARTFGALRISAGDAGTRVSLEARARRINPRIELEPLRATQRIGIASAEADAMFSGAGWWTGASATAPEHEEGASPVGPLLAGVLAFGHVFARAFSSVLKPLRPEPTTVARWSSLDFEAREANEADLAPLRTLRHGPGALVGCGAIGQAVAFTLGHVSRVDGHLDLVDPQALSPSNLQRYIGTSASDGEQRQQKVVLASRQLASAYPDARRFTRDWSGYLRQLETQRRPLQHDILLTALDSAGDRRLVQGSLPRLIINGWTRLSDCGVTIHDLVGPTQCLVCTYLPREASAARSDIAQLAAELGLLPMRVVHLLAGAGIDIADLRAIERSRRLPEGALDRWRGESLRPLYGELCGLAQIPAGEREQYLVPLPHASALAGLLVASELLKTAGGVGRRGERVEVSVIRGPGLEWVQPSARKETHPAPCICKDGDYLAGYREKWTS